MMREPTGWSWRSGHRQQQQASSNPVLTWASLQFLAPKKEETGSRLRRGGDNGASLASKSRPRFAAPTTASNDYYGYKENGTASTKKSKDDVVVQRKLEPIHSYLMLSTSDGGVVNTRSFDEHLESSYNPFTIGNVSIQKSSPHSSNYQVQCMGEKFTGFHRILFHDTSFYKAEVSPLAREFVNKKRNICVIVHGAHGTGRRRVLFGDHHCNEILDHNKISLSLNELCANPYRRQVSDDHDDDSISSIGSKGVSEIQNINTKTKAELLLRPKVHLIPQEVSFSVESSSSLHEGRRDSPSRHDSGGEKTGIIPKLMEDICKRLCKHHPQSSFCRGRSRGGDVPIVIPREQSSSKCLLTANTENSDAQKTTFHRTNSMETATTDNAHVTSEGNDNLIGVRVSCFEIVDDLASGETATHDLLRECALTEKWPVDEISSGQPQKQSRRDTFDRRMTVNSSISWGDGLSLDDFDDKDLSTDFGKQEESSTVSASNDIIHDPTTGMVYVEDSTEVRCLSKTAIMECLTKAEEARQRRKNGDDVVFGKLSHTVYLLTIEQNDHTSQGKVALTRQFVISTIDETMSNSASLALHSSCSVLNTVTRQLANYVATPPSCRNALTQLLRGSIGGDCRTLALGVADPTNDDITLPTLRFGEAISWVYNYWTGEDVSDMDSDSEDVGLRLTDNNLDCVTPPNIAPLHDNSKEKSSTPSTETSSGQHRDPPQSNIIAEESKKNHTTDSYDIDTRKSPQSPQPLARMIKPQPQVVQRQSSSTDVKLKETRDQDHHDDSSWRGTLAQIDEQLDLIRAKMKPNDPRKTADSENVLTDGPLKVEYKVLEPTSSVDHPSTVDINKTKDDELKEMRAEIKALRLERDNLKRRNNESALELEKAREDIFHLKQQQAEAKEPTNSEHQALSQPSITESNQISEPIKVCFRLRPKNKLESYRRSAMCIDASESSPNVRIDSSLYGVHNFCFDKVFGEDSTQRTVSDFFAGQFTSKLLNGVNCALILAGAKSSGKSHSLFGEIPAASQANNCSLPVTDAGILPNIVCDIYRKMKSSTSGVSYNVKCSFVVIHLERIIDLLRPQADENETIFARYSSEGLNLDGATESYCSDEEDVLDLIRRGKSFQSILSDTVGAGNDLFHTLFLLKVEASTGKRATLLLSEMLGFGATKKAINTSYNAATPHQRSSIALNRVVGALTHDASVEVPYQLSKMTSLLRDAVGGNCYTSVMITASPCKTTFVDTLNAIKLGLKLRSVRNTPNSTALETEDIHNADEKLRSMILDGQSKMTLLKQQYDKMLREKQATEDALAEERQQVKMIGLEKEQINLEVKRMKLREKRATDFIKCLRGLISHVKHDAEESRTMAIDQVIEMIGSDIDLSDLVDIDSLLQNEGFISKDEANLSPDDLFHKLLGSEGSDLSPTDVFSAGERNVGDSNGLRILRRDMRKIAKANVELQVLLKKEKSFVKSINKDKSTEEAFAMRKSRDKMTNCALTAVNKLNEIKSTNKMLTKQAKIIGKHNTCIEESMKELELKLRAAEDEVTRLEKSKLRQTIKLEALTGALFIHDTQTTLSKNSIRGTTYD